MGFPWVRPFPQKPLSATENQKAAIRRVGDRIISVVGMEVFLSESPQEIELFRKDLRRHFNGKEDEVGFH